MNFSKLLDQIATMLRQIAKALLSIGDPVPPTGEPDEDKDGKLATVKRVTDGDTFDVEFDDGDTATIRMIGIDTPETAQQYQDSTEYNVPDTKEGRAWLRTWGDQATMFTAEAFEEVEKIRVVTEGKGYFDRTLAYVYVGGEPLAEELLSHGLARVYTGEEFEKESEWLQIEETAQNANRGLWGFRSE